MRNKLNTVWENNMKRDRLRGMLLYPKAAKRLKKLKIISLEEGSGEFVFKGDRYQVETKTIHAQLDSKVFQFTSLETNNGQQFFRINPKKEGKTIKFGRKAASFFGETKENEEFLEDLFHDFYNM